VLRESRTVHSHTTVIIPLHDRVIFVSLLNCAEFSSRFPEIAQPLDAIPGIQFLAAGAGAVSRGFWLDLSQAPPRGVIGVVGELYAVWVSACWCRRS
jgi:hypothetical protein